ncbi:monovalent cation/H(+) antiporter subunit G [Streptomyces sp. WM6372]|uniref:monovalent cation/H(+) antiporter subunit G n=1 Tax=Streptomyces sp. WM6372 TaxID=1415555 RepID=UPI0006AE40A4|nr:monovalent cation/H(+) antiporter subunit G [Streptomyces sp. WM6372]
MAAVHAVAAVLLWLGVACLLAAAGALVLLRGRGSLARLHALAPANGLGVPLITCAVALEQGAGRAAAKTLLIGLLLAVGGTVTTIAIGKATADEEGRGRHG